MKIAVYRHEVTGELKAMRAERYEKAMAQASLMTEGANPMQPPVLLLDTEDPAFSGCPFNGCDICKGRLSLSVRGKPVAHISREGDSMEMLFDDGSSIIAEKDGFLMWEHDKRRCPCAECDKNRRDRIIDLYAALIDLAVKHCTSKRKIKKSPCTCSPCTAKRALDFYYPEWIKLPEVGNSLQRNLDKHILKCARDPNWTP